MGSPFPKRFLSASPEETEWYLYAKRIKIESDQKSREKEEQQKLERNINCGNRYQTSPHESLYSSERQNQWALEKQSCDAARKTFMREFCSQNCSKEGLPCRLSENERSTKKWSPENEGQNTTEGNISLNVGEQPLETGMLSVSSAADTCQNPQVLNPPPVQQNNSTEQDNKANGDNELKQNSSVASLNRHSFQMELLSHKSVSDKRWQQYQLLQVPFWCGASPVFSHIENHKNSLLKNVCSAEDENYSSSGKGNTAESDNGEKNNSLHVIPALKPFRIIQPLEIPDFQLPRISNEINNKMSSANLGETDWKDFEGQPPLKQSDQIHGVQNISEIGKQKLQNDKSSIRASNFGSEFKEKSSPPLKKQECSSLAEGEVSGTYFRGNSADIECNELFAENDFKDKMPENPEGDDDQKSKILIHISAKNVQNEKCVSCNDLLQRMGRKSSNENAGTFRIQMSIPVITEALEKNKLELHSGVHNSDSDICLHEAESKLSTKEILDFQRDASKNIVFEKNCPRIIVQNFSDKRVICCIFRGEEMFKFKFSFQNMLFGWLRAWTGPLHEDMPAHQDDNVTPWFCHPGTSNKWCDTQELVKSIKSTVKRQHNNKIFVSSLAVISKHLKVELLKKILASLFSSANTLLPAEGRSVQLEEQPLCGRKQNELNSCSDDSFRKNTEFPNKNCANRGVVSSTFVETIDFELHNEYQRGCFSRSLGEENTCLQRGALSHSQKSRLHNGRRGRKHHLLSRGNEVFSTYLRSVSHKNGMKKQILVDKCLIFLQGTSDCSLLDKIYCCNITKIQCLVGANLRFQRDFPAHSQLKFEKVKSKCTNQEKLVTTVKQEKKPNVMFNSSSHLGRFKIFPFVLCENRKQTKNGYRNFITSEVTHEVTYTMKKNSSTSNYINADGEECVNSRELQINCHNSLSKKSFSIFDTYEKIPLTTDSEDFDQISVVNQGSSIKKELCEERAVTGPKEVQCLPGKSNDALILPEQSKTTTEKGNPLLLLDRQADKHEDCGELDTYSSHLAHQKVPNTYLNSENLCPHSSHAYQSVTLPLDSSNPVNRGVSGDRHGKSSSSADSLNEGETVPATVQDPSRGSPWKTDPYLQSHPKKPEESSHGHEQANKTGDLESATLEQHLEYVKEQEERNDEQMHKTNESQCGTAVNDLIMSHSEDESKTLIAAEEELKMHLSPMNNERLEDVKDKHLPLENKITYEFELKREFDLVLEELRMFHEISKGNENNLSSLETNSHNNYWELNNSEEIDENVTNASQKEIRISSPIYGSMERRNITDSNESSLNKKILNENGDQEVPEEYCVSRLSGEEFLHSPVAEGYFLSRDVIRVQPLKTCKGPIRIGLSRKARPKQLHPYLK